MPAVTRFSHRLISGVLALSSCLAAAEPPAEWKPALDRISAQSLRGHLSFISSDLLEGRNTPSRGLDLAAEYIAAQFRRAGLEPAGDDGYFQTAKMMELEPDAEGFQMTFTDGERTFGVPRDQDIARAPHAVDLANAPVYRVEGSDLSPLPGEQVRGCAVVVDGGNRTRGLVAALQKLEPAVIIRLIRGNDGVPPRLVNAEDRPAGAPVIHVSDAESVKTLSALRPGLSGWKVTMHVAADRETDVKVRNVIGLLRGSDPTLQDTYVLLTAHYDHMGLAKSGDDRVFNGANDDGSGTVSVVEIGAALAALPRHPRRSIVFMTFFGEEEGLLGSRYYARHPVFPLQNTVADVNLEQLGRTDSTEGPQIANTTFSGFEYSDLPGVFEKAGQMTGIKVYPLPNGGNEFFNRSDNISFADHGIVAHTAVVAADFPDYHAVGDEWQKIDYDNMANVDRMLALGILMIADSAQAPKWNPEKKKEFSRR